MITNVYEYLKNSYKNYPKKTAFDDSKKSIDYETLYINSNKVAMNLIKHFKKPIIIYMEKSVECVTSMMGVIRSGNFYTIIDTKMPLDRVEMIKETLKPVLVITTDSLSEKAKQYFGNSVLIFDDLLTKEVDFDLLEEISNNTIDTDPIYSLFTSGSTGVPKGYIINHRGVIDFCEAMTDAFKLSENDIYANQSPLYFDLSIADIYCNIKNGSTNYLIPQSMFMFPIKVIEYLNQKKVNFIFWVPSALVLMAPALEKMKPDYLKKVLFCGEAMPNKQLNIWRKHLSDVFYANLYGPAETVDASTYYIVDRKFEDSEPLPIGKPFKNTRIMLLDDNLELIEEPNVTGELYILGSSLAMGYYNNIDKTKEAFVQNPLNKLYIENAYKTGDLAYYNEYKELVYSSRKDFQIKHMGYRIELGEIENVTLGIKEISQVACVYDDINKKIILFFEGEEIDNKEVLNYLKNKLPNYMMPSKVKYVKELPHNANGKIDRKKLKEMLGD